METITQTVQLAQPDTPLTGAEVATAVFKLEPWMIFVIVLAALAALLVSLYLMYGYVVNLRTTNIHRNMLRDAVYDARLTEIRKRSAFEEEWSADWEIEDSIARLERERANLLSERDVLIAAVERLEQLKEPTDEDAAELLRSGDQLEAVRSRLRNEFPEEKIIDLKAELKRQEAERKAQEQEREFRMHNQAAQEADLLVPESFSAAGMGITASFFIELTAILTIIFGILILGIIGRLGAQEISTILAAIAGYVLGKTAGASSAPQAAGPGRPSEDTQS